MGSQQNIGTSADNMRRGRRRCHKGQQRDTDVGGVCVVPFKPRTFRRQILNDLFQMGHQVRTWDVRPDARTWDVRPGGVHEVETLQNHVQVFGSE